jgi:hypothetical protein
VSFCAVKRTTDQRRSPVRHRTLQQICLAVGSAGQSTFHGCSNFALICVGRSWGRLSRHISLPAPPDHAKIARDFANCTASNIQGLWLGLSFQPVRGRSAQVAPISVISGGVPKLGVIFYEPKNLRQTCSAGDRKNCPDLFA